ncbi:cytochrome c-type biogenesis protein [uncultured Sphingomonas sp.]|uniref:cytochrome c-type biogenesis protein n=1 Tax=uncultured Sphingomonas sp. TaxID=158754 RepID=UPI0035CAFAE5
MRWPVALLLLTAAPARADGALPPARYANEQLRDPAREAQARALMAEIRCVVCQGQSIADSDADLAGDMRALVRERIDRGEAPAAVRAWLIQRYGAYITYDPPLTWLTWPLWLAPAALLAIGVLVARTSIGRR